MDDVPKDIDEWMREDKLKAQSLIAKLARYAMDLESQVAELEAEAAEWEQSFDVYHAAETRAIQKWRKAHPGNDRVMPDKPELSTENRQRGKRLIVVLALPPQELKPNIRAHRMAKASKTTQYRAEAKMAGLIAKKLSGQAEPLEIASVQIAAYWRTVRKMDPDNLVATMKAAFDGLTDAEIWPDDREIVILPPFQAKDAENPRIEIHIENGVEVLEYLTKLGHFLHD